MKFSPSFVVYSTKIATFACMYSYINSGLLYLLSREKCKSPLSILSRMLNYEIILQMGYSHKYINP